MFINHLASLSAWIFRLRWQIRHTTNILEHKTLHPFRRFAMLRTGVRRTLGSATLLTLAASVAGCPPRFPGPPTTATSGWWTFQHDLGRTGYLVGAIGSSPKLFWDVPVVSGTISLTPPVFGAIGDTFRVFIGSGYGDNKMYALSPYTGAVLWTFPAAANNGFFGAPAAANDNVYAATLGSTPQVYALGQANGGLVWQTPLPVGSRASVAVGQGRVFVNTDQHKLYALNQQTGAVLWSASTSTGTTSQESSPSLGFNNVYVGSDSALFAFNVATGALVWNYPLTDVVGFSSPVIQIASGTTPALVLIGTNDRKLHAVNALTGAAVWGYTASATLAFGSVAIAQGKVFVFDFSSVVALDVNTGALLWTQATPRIPRHSPAVVGSVLYYSDDQAVNELNTGTGAPVWKAAIPGNGDPNSPGAEMASALEILLVPNKGHVHAFR
jgi:outer membrane protein assembly factor BamB